jgi:hypothetical protein
MSAQNHIVDENPARGRITSGLAAGTLVERTIDFVLAELPGWRDDPNRPVEQSEERLNAQLCKYLQVAARRSMSMVVFHHEEKQTGVRRVDFSALPAEGQINGALFDNIYDPFLVFEGKRLPPPKNQASRKREYVTGGSATSGGIQRFKLGLHGAKHETAVMIGYIQEGTPAGWVERINGWMCELEGSRGLDGANWSSLDRLANFVEIRQQRISTCSSKHTRSGNTVSPEISLRHLWVCLCASMTMPK